MSNEDVKWTTYRDPATGLIIEHPGSWVTMPGLAGTIVALIEPEGDRADGFAANVNVVGARATGDADVYLREQVTSMRDTLDGFELVDAEVRQGSLSAMVDLVGSYRQADREIVVRQRHVLGREWTLVASATAPANRSAELSETFDRVLASVRAKAAAS